MRAENSIAMRALSRIAGRGGAADAFQPGASASRLMLQPPYATRIAAEHAAVGAVAERVRLPHELDDQQDGDEDAGDEVHQPPGQPGAGQAHRHEPASSTICTIMTAVRTTAAMP